MPTATILHTIRVYHTDSGSSGFCQRMSLLEVTATDPRDPVPPSEIAWGHVERFGHHVDHHPTPVACALGVRYPNGLASCLRAWGCRVERVLATSSDRTEAAALASELGAPNECSACKHRLYDAAPGAHGVECPTRSR